MNLKDALTGIRVLDLTSNLPGPYATLILGDLGADVIKIESLEGDYVRNYPPFIETESVMSLLLNRNKRSIALNLKSEEGLRIFYSLVKTADVVIEGFRPGVTKRLKIDLDTLKEYNPNLIYCSIIGYQENDTRSGHDMNYLASAGILNISGPKAFPVPPGVPIGDIGGGSLPAVISILAALVKRGKEPQKLVISITEQMIPWLTIAASTYIAGIGDPQREEHMLSGYLPFYRIYKTKDKIPKFVTFASLETKFWHNFCQSIDRNDLIGKQFDLELLNSELPKIFSQKTQEEWEEWFEVYDIPGASIISVAEALEENSRLFEIQHPSLGSIKQIKSPFTNETKSVLFPPALGENTKEILKEINLSKDYEKLKAAGIVK